jgi:hypothetical protein
MLRATNLVPEITGGLRVAEDVDLKVSAQERPRSKTQWRLLAVVGHTTLQSIIMI